MIVAYEIESRIKKDPITECWVWQKSKIKGYGRLWDRDRGTVVLAHRASWEVFNGPIPANLCVLHRCDNPSCVNPNHLFLGTISDNNIDMVAKSRNYTHQPTHCPRGHALSVDNVYVIPSTGGRCCVKCKRVHNWAYNNKTSFEYALKFLTSKKVI